MNFGEGLKRIMDRKPKIKGKTLAEIVGVSPQLITEIRGGRKLPSYKNLNGILNNLNILESEKSELLELWKMEKDSEYKSPLISKEKDFKSGKKIEYTTDINHELSKFEINEEKSREVITLSLVGRVSAGHGYLNFSESNKRRLYYPRAGVNYKECFVVTVVGDSMEPKILEDFELIVNPKLRNIDENINKIVVASINGETYVKTLRKINSKFYLESSNKKYKDIEIRKSDEFYIIGRVIETRYESEL